MDVAGDLDVRVRFESDFGERVVVIVALMGVR
jgi:hypothetical protein